MKLELCVAAFFAAFVPSGLALMDPGAMMSMMGMDLKLPPKPPKSVFPHLYMTRQELMARIRYRRRQQEQALFQKLKSMTPQQVADFKAKLSPTQLQQLVARLKYLNQQEQQRGNPAPATQGTGSTPGPNTVLSGANKIRRPGSAGSTTQQRRLAALRLRARRIRAMIAAARRRSPLTAINKYQSYRKKSMGAIAAGCTFPAHMESTMDSFFAFSSGGCRMGGAICAMSGQSCVDTGGSIMCCPLGYTSGTLDMVQYMEQMKQFMAQF